VSDLEVWEFFDNVGNRVTVEVLTSGVAVLTIYDDDPGPMSVAKTPTTARLMITPEAAQELADAVRRACTE
jgi:hypothetical protein